MKRATILTVLLSSALAFGQKVEVSDLSAADSPVSFSGTAKVSKIGTICVVTAHNKSTQSVLAFEVAGEFTNPQGWNQSMGLSYDHFFKDAGIAPGEDVDVVDPELFDSEIRDTYIINGVLVKPHPPKDIVCHAEAKVLFAQLGDGSTWGDYQTWKDLMAKRAKHMAILSHLVDAYDTGGEAALAAAADEPELRSPVRRLKYMAAYFKITLIDLVRKRLATAQKRQASGVF